MATKKTPDAGAAKSDEDAAIAEQIKLEEHEANVDGDKTPDEDGETSDETPPPLSTPEPNVDNPQLDTEVEPPTGPLVAENVRAVMPTWRSELTDDDKTKLGELTEAINASIAAGARPYIVEQAVRTSLMRGRTPSGLNDEAVLATEIAAELVQTDHVHPRHLDRAIASATQPKAPHLRADTSKDGTDEPDPAD